MIVSLICSDIVEFENIEEEIINAVIHNCLRCNNFSRQKKKLHLPIRWDDIITPPPPPSVGWSIGNLLHIYTPPHTINKSLLPF